MGRPNYIVMITYEGSTKVVNFMNPRSGVLVLGRGHISHIVKLHLFFKNLNIADSFSFIFVCCSRFVWVLSCIGDRMSESCVSYF